MTRRREGSDDTFPSAFARTDVVLATLGRRPGGGCRRAGCTSGRRSGGGGRSRGRREPLGQRRPVGTCRGRVSGDVRRCRRCRCSRRQDRVEEGLLRGWKRLPHGLECLHKRGDVFGGRSGH